MGPKDQHGHLEVDPKKTHELPRPKYAHEASESCRLGHKVCLLFTMVWVEVCHGYSGITHHRGLSLALYKKP